MKKRSIFTYITAVLILITTVFPDIKAYTSQTTGTGSATDPYKIYTVEQLYGINPNSAAGYGFMENIDLNVQDQMPIESTENDFADSLDGVDYTINSVTGNIQGDGTESDPYIIESKEQLNDIKNNLSAHYALANDIDFEYGTFSPIGTNSSPFTGSFDGCGYTISNVSISSSTTDYVGLFGCTNNAEIMNVNLKNVTVTGKEYIGSLIGRMNGGSVTDCSVSGIGKVTGGGRVGGLIGQSTGKVENSSSTVHVTASSDYCGGLIGTANSNTTITNCYATGAVSSSTGYTGSLIGSVAPNTTVQSCFATGSATCTNSNSTNYTGGLIGYASSGSISVSDSFSTGDVNSSGGRMGGLIGYVYGTATVTIKNSYSTSSLAGKSTKGGLITGNATIVNSYFDSNKAAITTPATQARTAEQLKTKSTFVDWDFSQVWDMTDGEYPYLRGFLDMSTGLAGLYSEGTGSAADPYKIYTVEQLYGINQNLAASYELATDIDLGSQNWIPIGSTGNNGNTFIGSLDGKGYEISNLKSNYSGLFAKTTGATIKNVLLKDINVSGSTNLGGLIGTADGGTIDNCALEGTIVISGSSYMGSLIGQANSTVITNCSATGEISVNGTSSNVGGLIGCASAPTINNCSLTGVISVKGGDYTGGLVGRINAVKTDVSGCSVSGTLSVKGKTNVGGLAGSIVPSSRMTITNCFVDATGLVTGSTNVGGLIGNNSDTVQNSSSKIDVEATTNICGGLIGHSTYGNIINCYATGNVVSDGGSAGGLVGSYNAQAASNIISSCYATGDVTSNRISSLYAGGLIGYGFSNDSTYYKDTLFATTIENCFSLGNINGRSCCSFIGFWEKIPVTSGTGVSVVKLDIKNCYAVGKVNGNTNVSMYNNKNVTVSATNVVSGTGKTTAEMMSKATFKNWDFTNIWTIEEGLTYPYLKLLEKPNGVMLGEANYQGDGTESNPYIIESKEQLSDIKYNLSAHYVLANDIDLGYEAFSPIGTSLSPFTGNFDGCGYTISNVSISGGVDYAGLFGCTNNAEIKNVNLKNMTVTGKEYAGSLIGYMNGGSVTNCSVSGAGKVSGNKYVGGLIGNGAGTVENSSSTVPVTSTATGILVAPTYHSGGLIGRFSGSATNCYATGAVRGIAHVGGLMGYVAGTVTNCYATGSVHGTGTLDSSSNVINRTGGLIGYVNGGEISGCFAAGSVVSTGSATKSHAGGLIGYAFGGPTVSNCFSIGDVDSHSDAGGYMSGLVGYSISTATIKNCYSAGKLTGNASKGGLVSGNATVTNSYFDSSKTAITQPVTQARTTAQLKTKTTFVDWDYSQVWTITDGNYPYLKVFYNPFSVGLQAPTDINIETVTPTSIVLSWNGVYGAMGYELSYGSGVSVTLSEANAVIDDLIPNKQYEIKIRSTGTAQTSDWSVPVSVTTAPLDSGDGTVDAPYLIYNAEQLSATNNDLASFYKLMIDIDLESVPFTPIGSANAPFSGGFDGNGCTIKNLMIYEPDLDNVGLFGYTSNAVIKNLKLAGVDVVGKNNVGAIIGFMSGGVLDNCIAKGIMQIKGEEYFDGLVGNTDGSPEITGCSFESFANGNVSIEKTLSLVNGNIYTITLTTANMPATQATIYKITYDPAKLTLVDFAAQTKELNIKAGKIPDTELEILTNANGVITFKLNKAPANNNFSGVLTLLKFKALTDDSTVIMFEQ